MITRLQPRDRTAWLKRYDEPMRRLCLGALDWLVRRLGVTPLRPPPRYRSAAARDVEQRRLQQLAAAGVRVPEILATRRRGPGARGLGKAVRVLRASALAWTLLLTGGVLGLDLINDGDLDMLLALTNLLF